jgi:hypothetical protein
MPHASQVVYCTGPDSAHAFELIPLQPRNGALDALCPVCQGHGQWNTEIDLVSFRCKRAICGRCYGEGWVETGSDPVAVLDIVMAPEGYPKWVIRYIAEPDLPDNENQPTIAAAPITAVDGLRNPAPAPPLSTKTGSSAV